LRNTHHTRSASYRLIVIARMISQQT